MDEQKKALLSVLGTAADVVADSDSVQAAVTGLRHCLSLPSGALYTHDLAECIREVMRRVEDLPDASDAARMTAKALAGDAEGYRDVVKALAMSCAWLADHGGR